MKTQQTVLLTIFSVILTCVCSTRIKRFLSLMMIAIPMFAQTSYYISNNGDNGNNGLTDKTSWQTPAKIYLFSNFQPGDSILFKRGDIFTGQILDTLKGTVNNPIVIGAYGTGAKPIIYGDCRELTWMPIAGRTGYYKAYLGGYGNRISSYFYQWRNGTWLKSTALTYRSSNPAVWETFLDGLAEGDFGISVGNDSLFLHTYGNLTFPATRDSIRVYRYTNQIFDTSHDVVIRDLDIRCFIVGFETKTATVPIGFSNIVFRNIYMRNNLGGNIYMTSTTNGIIDSCYVDTTGGSSIYLNTSTKCIIRHNTVMNVLTLVDGIPCSGDLCGIGVQGSFTNSFNWSGVGYNTVEYNKLYNIYNGFLDFWWNIGDTIRYNEGHGARSGNPCHGTNLVITHNNLTFFPSGGNGANLSQNANGNVTFTYNKLDSVKDYGIWVSSNDSNGTITINHNTVRMTIPYRTYINYKLTERVTSTENYYIGTNCSFIDSTVFPYSFADLALFQSATGHEAGSVWHSSLDSTVNVHLENTQPLKIELEQNYPNPFNPSTIISFRLFVTGRVRLSLYDMLGREITTLLNEEKSAGTYNVKFNASKLTSGIYFYRLSIIPAAHEKFESFTETKKFILLR